jgi:hypothetical protein
METNKTKYQNTNNLLFFYIDIFFRKIICGKLYNKIDVYYYIYGQSECCNTNI